MPKGNPGISRNTLGKELASVTDAILCAFAPFNEERFIASLKAKGLSDQLISAAVKEQRSKIKSLSVDELDELKDKCFSIVKNYTITEDQKQQ